MEQRTIYFDVADSYGGGWERRARAGFFMRQLLLVAMIVLSASCTPVPEEEGILEGHVTIGPLVPVVQDGGPEPTPAPDVCAGRQIVIYAQDGQTEITRVQIAARGNYRVTLPVGTYVVDINRLGIDRGIELPKTVRIVGGQTTRLDVEVDTGIR